MDIKPTKPSLTDHTSLNNFVFGSLLRQTRSSQRLFVTERQGSHVFLPRASWPLWERPKMTRVTTAGAFLSTALWHFRFGAAEQGLGRRGFYGGETEASLPFSDKSIPGSLSFRAPSPLKNSPCFSPAKAKQTGQGNGFYFKCTILPSKSSNWPAAQI